MTNKRIHLVTYGCQMNERDSEEVLGMLIAQGYQIAGAPEQADVILFNTCSVRQHAEERAIGKMRELSFDLKSQHPELVLGMIGCMAKLQQDQLFKLVPNLDLVAGPAELYDLPYLLAEIQEKRQWEKVSDTLPGGTTNGKVSDTFSGKVLAVGRAFRPLDQKPAGEYRTPGVDAFVTIMEGCDKACTYCIVPKTRGQEISRPAAEILDEIRQLGEAGYQQVTLLGQNVNSYGKRFPDGSGYKGPLGRLRLLEDSPEQLLDFPKLLRMIDQKSYIPRIRFTTSHPFDANERLFEALRECRTICEWLHLPVQSGSNRILRAMRRGYTADAYLKKIEALRHLVPGISLSTDIIVGFPGETEEDVADTERLMREVRYDSAYVFKYSPRPGTDAAAKEDDVPQDAKEARNQRLLAVQRGIEDEALKAWEGRCAEILVESRGKFASQWFGRTRGFHGVIVESADDLLGKLVHVRMTRGTGHTLFGDVDASSHCACRPNGRWQISRSS